MSEREELIYIDEYVIMLRYKEKVSSDSLTIIKEILMSGMNGTKQKPKVAVNDEI